MSAAPKLHIPDVRCPRCGAPPRLRVTQKQIDLWKGESPEELVQTYQCSFDLGRDELGRQRKCNAIYGITAGSIQRAAQLG